MLPDHQKLISFASQNRWFFRYLPKTSFFRFLGPPLSRPNVKGSKRGPQFSQNFIKKLGFTPGIHFWTSCVVLVSFLYAPGLNLGNLGLILSPFWERFGMFFVRFWRFMALFWISSTPSRNLEESIFGSLITDLFFVTFFKSGRVDFRMVRFGRDIQKYVKTAAKLLQAEFCSRGYTCHFCILADKNPYSVR